MRSCPISSPAPEPQILLLFSTASQSGPCCGVPSATMRPPASPPSGRGRSPSSASATTITLWRPSTGRCSTRANFSGCSITASAVDSVGLPVGCAGAHRRAAPGDLRRPRPLQAAAPGRTAGRRHATGSRDYTRASARASRCQACSRTFTPSSSPTWWMTPRRSSAWAIARPPNCGPRTIAAHELLARHGREIDRADGLLGALHQPGRCASLHTRLPRGTRADPVARPLQHARRRGDPAPQSGRRRGAGRQAVGGGMAWPSRWPRA